MTKNIKEVFQLKITLNSTKPPIWRRIIVPSEYSFWDLHVAIQDAMGWLDYHLHTFVLRDPVTNKKIEIRMQNEKFEDSFNLNDIVGLGDFRGLDTFTSVCFYENNEKIAKYFSDITPKAIYEYDFGDSWGHTVKFEKKYPVARGDKYPHCIAGKMACPPEDCGGVWGYYRYLSIMNDPRHIEHKEIIEWMGEGFDPVSFDPKNVVFDNPKKRYKSSL